MTRKQLEQAARKAFGDKVVELWYHKNCAIVREEQGNVLYACSTMSGKPRFYAITAA